MPARRDELTDEQWVLIEPLFPKPRVGLRGRPQRDTREVMNGVLWILRSGRALARFARAISAIPNVPSPLCSLGQNTAHNLNRTLTLN
jgi:transposase